MNKVLSYILLVLLGGSQNLLAQSAVKFEYFPESQKVAIPEAYREALLKDERIIRSIKFDAQLPSCIDQGDSGLCYAFATNASLVAAEYRQSGESIRIDPYVLSAMSYLSLVREVGSEYPDTWRDPIQEGREKEDHIDKTERAPGGSIGAMMDFEYEMAFIEGRNVKYPMFKDKTKSAIFRKLYSKHRDVRNSFGGESDWQPTIFDSGTVDQVTSGLEFNVGEQGSITVPLLNETSRSRFEKMQSNLIIPRPSQGSLKEQGRRFLETSVPRIQAYISGAPFRALSAPFDTVSISFTDENGVYYDYRYESYAKSRHREEDSYERAFGSMTEEEQRNRFDTFLNHYLTIVRAGVPPQTGLVTTGVESSTDGGITWKKIEVGMNHAVILKEVIVDDDGVPFFIFQDSNKDGSPENPFPSLLRLPFSDFWKISSYNYHLGPNDHLARAIALPDSAVIPKKPEPLQKCHPLQLPSLDITNFLDSFEQHEVEKEDSSHSGEE